MKDEQFCLLVIIWEQFVNLCSRVLLLSEGMINRVGSSNEIINLLLTNKQSPSFQIKDGILYLL